MTQIDSSHYSPTALQFLSAQRLCELGPGSPEESMVSQLSDLTEETLFQGANIVDGEMATCCLSGLWLLYDFLDQSHTISQSIYSTTGSYWHGIMHRREPDFGNAKYWFRKVDQHNVFEPLLVESQKLSTTSESNVAKKIEQLQTWDPYLFVDLCQQVGDSYDQANLQDNLLCRQIAQAEWRLVFDFCYQSAIGES